MSDWVIKGYDCAEEFYSRSFRRMEQSQIEHLLKKLYEQTLPINDRTRYAMSEDASFIVTHPDRIGKTLAIGSELRFIAKRITH
nr:hypothetical protein [uncultured Cohaesibacter sp.]